MSAQAKHTPGPWVVVPFAHSKAFKVTADPNNARLDICNVIAFGNDAKANATLIAAAPELLAFAQEFVRVWAGPGATDSPLEAQARAAIARATGAA